MPISSGTYNLIFNSVHKLMRLLLEEVMCLDESNL